MTIDDGYSDLPEVLQNVADIFSHVHEEVTDELRSDERNELLDTVAFERQQLQMWERMQASSQPISIHLNSGTSLTQVRCQHACEEWIVVTDDRFTYVVPCENVYRVSGLGLRATNQNHRGISCGFHVLANLEQHGRQISIAHSAGENISCEIAGVWRDCIDVRVWHDIVTLALRSIDFVRIKN